MVSSRLSGSLVVLVVAAGCGGGGEAPADATSDDAPAELTAAELLAAIQTCDPVLGGPYATDSGGAATISVCGLPGAVVWQADLDVDCDGKQSTACNSTTDPAYQNQTAATDSLGDPLDAAALPYVVVPGHSTRFDYRSAGLSLGSVFAVIYGDRIEYGVFGDIGPTSIIGEASYAMADALGIDPDPSTGGADSGVAYIGFTGADAIPDVIEDHAMAVAIGAARARALVGGP